jgi:hypothetical protein
MEKIPESKNDLEYFYSSNFQEKFNPNNASQLLKLFSHLFMRANNMPISKYMEIS